MSGIDDELRRWAQEERERRLAGYRQAKLGNMENRQAYNLRYEQQRTAKRQQAYTLREKPDVCDLCFQRTTKMVVDHDHKTNAFRGWICNRCNVALGLLNDDADLLERMAAYIRKAGS